MKAGNLLIREQLMCADRDVGNYDFLGHARTHARRSRGNLRTFNESTFTLLRPTIMRGILRRRRQGWRSRRQKFNPARHAALCINIEKSMVTCDVGVPPQRRPIGGRARLSRDPHHSVRETVAYSHDRRRAHSVADCRNERT